MKAPPTLQQQFGRNSFALGAAMTGRAPSGAQMIAGTPREQRRWLERQARKAAKKAAKK